jgi:salicylate hydroxylase
VIISSVSSREQIPQALQAYQHSRKLRAEKVQQSALQNRDSLHLPDGLEQEARDEMFRLAEKGLENPDAFHHKETQKALWGHDPEEAALEAWKSALAIH